MAINVSLLDKRNCYGAYCSGTEACKRKTATQKTWLRTRKPHKKRGYQDLRYERTST